jgi:hypothetical protein
VLSAAASRLATPFSSPVVEQQMPTPPPSDNDGSVPLSNFEFTEKSTQFNSGSPKASWIQVPESSGKPLQLQQQPKHIRQLLNAAIHYVNYLVCFHHAFPDAVKAAAMTRQALGLAARDLGSGAQPALRRFAVDHEYAKLLMSTVSANRLKRKLATNLLLSPRQGSAFCEPTSKKAVQAPYRASTAYRPDALILSVPSSRITLTYSRGMMM